MIWSRRIDPIAGELEALGLEAAAARRLSMAGTLLDLKEGTTLCEQGERGTQAFFILEGHCQVLTETGVVTVGPGDVVGELATLDPDRTRNATVVAASPLVVLVFDPRTFRSIADEADLRPTLVPERAAA